MRAALALLVFGMLAGCTDPAIRVTLLRVAPPGAENCGAPQDARTVLISARGEFPPIGNTVSWTLGDAPVLDITAFPEDTRALAVEVIGSGGALRAVGLTPAFSFADLADGDQLRVMMAPRRGVCPTEAMAAPRARPLMARAGAGALVVGGVDDGGEPVRIAELYDPTTGAFDDLGDTVYGDPALGLRGASMTQLSDGRVVVAGGAEPAYQVFDPRTRAFDAARFLAEPRAHHAAVALADGRLLIAGGCAQMLAAGTCAPGSALTSSAILDIDAGEIATGPPLSTPRIGGQAFLLASGEVVLIGGVDASGAPVAVAERLDVAAGTYTVMAGFAGAVGAPLAAGGVLTAFSPVDAAPGKDVAVIPPAKDAASPLADAARFRAGATLTPLWSGRVLVLGGGNAAPALYLPASGQFFGLDELAVRLPVRDHAAVALADGTVLIAGGRAADDRALSEAWIFRPDLAGPFQPGATVVFTDSELREALVPADPAHAWIEVGDGESPTHYMVEATGPADTVSAWAVVAGPKLSRPTLAIRAAASAPTAGVAILIGFESASRFWAISLAAEKPAVLLRVEGAMREAISGCRGDTIDAEALVADPLPPSVSVSFAGGSLAVALDGDRILECSDVSSVPFGHVGVGVVGNAGDRVRIDSILVSR